jgi:CDP-glycerol glycerophosphotransferase (TagB/SpsB family)
MLTRLRASRIVRTLVRRFGVHRATLLLGLAQLPVLRILQLVLKRLPRDRHLVVMGSSLDRFADNAAYLYLHMSEHSTDLRPVWVSGSADVVRRLRRRGHRAERRWSWRGVLTTLRAGTFVYSAYRSDINRWLSPGAVTLSLWHGLPIKRVEAGIESRAAQRRAWLKRLADAGREAPPDFLLSSSSFVTTCFSPAFGVPPERCWELGYPRNDHLLSSPSNPPAALLWHDDVWQQLSSASRVVGLFLTWRDDRVDDALDEGLVRQLAEVCTRHGAILTYKAHYNVAPTTTPSTCVVLPADADLHAYLGLCDVLMTDYSSIALDFLLMRRPVVYFMPDVEHYASTRGFAVDPLALPGMVTLDPEALLESLEAVLESPGSWTPTPADDLLMRQMWGGYSGDASRMIVDSLESTLRGHENIGGQRGSLGHTGELTSSSSFPKYRRNNISRTDVSRGARRARSV